jgi:hypothetical protein
MSAKFEISIVTSTPPWENPCDGNNCTAESPEKIWNATGELAGAPEAHAMIRATLFEERRGVLQMSIELFTKTVVAAAKDPNTQCESESNPLPCTVTSAPPSAEPKLGSVEEMFAALTTKTSDRITIDWLLRMLIEQPPTWDGCTATVIADDALSKTCNTSQRPQSTSHERGEKSNSVVLTEIVTSVREKATTTEGIACPTKAGVLMKATVLESHPTISTSKLPAL